MFIILVILLPSPWGRWGKMCTSLLPTWRKSGTARLLSRWETEGRVRLLNACQWIQHTHTIVCLFASWFDLVIKSKIQMESVPRERTLWLAVLPIQEHPASGQKVSLSDPFLLEAWVTHSWVNFAPRESWETRWDTVLGIFPWLPTFLRAPQVRNSEERYHSQSFQKFILAFSSSVTPFCFSYKTFF